MHNPLKFENTIIDIIQDGTEFWVRGTQICQCLGYKNPAEALDALYDEHHDEFRPSLTKILAVMGDEDIADERVFSPYGAWMLVWFSQKKHSKRLRVWIRTVLEKHVEQLKRDAVDLGDDSAVLLMELKENLLWVSQSLKTFHETMEAKMALGKSNPDQAARLAQQHDDLYEEMTVRLQKNAISLKAIIASQDTQGDEDKVYSVFPSSDAVH
jgi:prophage antirepressor-like protein